MTNDLKALLTPDLFQLMVDTHLPFNPTEPIDYAQAIGIVFNGTTQPEKWRLRAWPILVALSNQHLQNEPQPDLLSFLPPPSSPTFPNQALGLQILLDQAPAMLLKGINKRWSASFSLDLSLEYARQLQALPEDQNPGCREAWGDITVDYFVLVRFWLSAAFVHHERAGVEAAAFTEATRVLLEKEFSVRDPARDLPHEERWDLYGFPKLLAKGQPEGPLDVAEGYFWFGRVMDAHKPQLDLFGRYPNRNAALGRVDTTAEEEEFLEKAGMYSKMNDDIRKKIREDVVNGTWTAIQGGPDGI